MPRAADGAVEFLVRVANVARDATATLPAKFLLRVEVGGFYDGPGGPGGPRGSSDYDADEADEAVEAILAELSPGFAVDGPGHWACSGGADARAVYDLVTPDETARDIKRLGSGQKVFQHFDQIMSNTAVALQNMQRQGGSEQLGQQGVDASAIMGMMAAAREAMQAKVENSGMRESAAAAARAAGARTTTRFAATFVGQSREGGECQMLVRATLAGRQGGMQTLAAAVDTDADSAGETPEFFLNVIPTRRLKGMHSMMDMPTSVGKDFNVGQMFQQAFQQMAQRASEKNRWQLCTMTEKQRRSARSRGCAVCTAGRLRLRSAEQGHVAGAFTFDVVRWPEKGNKCHPIDRDKVRGYFNVTSTDDGHNDPKGMFGAKGLFKGVLAMPGLPIHDLGADD